MRKIFIAISARLVPDTMIDSLLEMVLRQAAAAQAGRAPGSAGGVWRDEDGKGPAGKDAGPSHLCL